MCVCLLFYFCPPCLHHCHWRDKVTLCWCHINTKKTNNKQVSAADTSATTRWSPERGNGLQCVFVCVFQHFVCMRVVYKRVFPFCHLVCVVCSVLFYSVCISVCADEQHLPRCLLGHRGPHEHEHTHLRNSRQQKQTRLPLCQLKLSLSLSLSVSHAHTHIYTQTRTRAGRGGAKTTKMNYFSREEDIWKNMEWRENSRSDKR